MKVYINTLTSGDIAERQEVDENFDPVVTIPYQENIYRFIPGEWVHIPDDFVIDQIVYPFLQDAETVLRRTAAIVLWEHGVVKFMQGIVEFSLQYSQEIPEVVVDLMKYLPDIESVVGGGEQ